MNFVVFSAHGYTGDVTVNGNLRDLKAFKPNVAFITQDTSLQPHLTVKEAMHFSANLKIGAHMTKNEKRERVSWILLHCQTNVLYFFIFVTCHSFVIGTKNTRGHWLI